MPLGGATMMTTFVRRTALAGAAALALGIPAATASADAHYGSQITSVEYVSGEMIRVTGEITCPAGHTWVLQMTASQKSGSFGAQTIDGTCTGEPQTFENIIHRMQLQDPLPYFHRGRVTLDVYGGSYLCDELSCNDLNLADLERAFVLK